MQRPAPRSQPASPLQLTRLRSAFACALHMHQPLIPAGGDDLRTAGIINNLQYMMEHQDIGDNHNAPVFRECYRRMGEIIPDLVLNPGIDPPVYLRDVARIQTGPEMRRAIADLDGEGEQLVENLLFLRGEHGDHPAGDFQQIAERNDLAGSIDRHIIPGLLKTFVDSSERQIINLSINSILDYAFPGWLVEQMKDACIEGNRIVLQIAASAAHSNLRPAQRLMNELKPLGCQLSVGQFDDERKSLQLLEHLDASYVKLAHHLTVDLLSDSKKQEAIRRIVEAAKQHGIAVIADEVADTSSLAVLWQCGVKLISGAFLSESSQVIAQ